MARTVQAEQSSHFDSGKKLLQLTRAATPKQAEVIHALIHHRLNGGEYKPPAGQAPFARQVKKEIDGVGGGVDLKGLGKLALAQQYRTNLSPAGAELLDRIRSGTPAQLEVLNKQFSERLDSSAARHAWAPRIS